MVLMLKCLTVVIEGKRCSRHDDNLIVIRGKRCVRHNDRDIVVVVKGLKDFSTNVYLPATLRNKTHVMEKKFFDRLRLNNILLIKNAILKYELSRWNQLCIRNYTEYRLGYF